MAERYDCIVVGGGHNGLVCANYLARGGRRVLVLERRHVVGGACVSESLWPGYRVSTASYVVSLMLPQIIDELALRDHGYEVLPRNPSSFTPLPDRRSLLLGPDDEANRSEISKFSKRDAEAYPKYVEMLERVAGVVDAYLASPPPQLLPWPSTRKSPTIRERVRQVSDGLRLTKLYRELGDRQAEAIELLMGAARPLLDRWFESDALKATLATDAIIGTFQPISAAGTSYVLLHHVMGETNGVRGVWGYVRGGMGGLTQALAAAAEREGVEIRCDADVAAATLEHGRVTGVELADGERILANQVASNLDARRTFEHLVGVENLDDDFVSSLRTIDYSSASLKINLGLRELPNFECLPGSDQGPQHVGTIHFSPGLDYIEQAYADAALGRPSSRPIIEMTIPSTVDDTVAPVGRHVASLFVQYAPYSLAEGNWDDCKEEFADRCIAEIARYAPNFPQAIEHRQVLTPVDLEQTFGLTGGNIFQGSMSLNQLFSLRPLPGWSDYRTPIDGLFLCGSAAHPGGGVTGACGYNAANVMLQ